MANRNFNDVQSIERKSIILSNTVSINSSAAVVSDNSEGEWTKTGTGEYTLTLPDKYMKCLAAQVTLEAATAVDLVAQIKSIDVTSAKTIVINLNAEQRLLILVLLVRFTSLYT